MFFELNYDLSQKYILVVSVHVIGEIQNNLYLSFMKEKSFRILYDIADK